MSALSRGKMSRETISAIILGVAVIGGALMFATQKPESPSAEAALASKFVLLSQNGNSSCSAAFAEGIGAMADGSRLQGSCCSAMNFHRYSEQVSGLQKFRNIPEIPPDPYDIDAVLAGNLKGFYDVRLTPDEQKEYDFAMEHSDEKGPCCCKCWRWYVYGGLAKKLIRDYKFTGEQITEVWNLSDGCGGEGDHANHS